MWNEWFYAEDTWFYIKSLISFNSNIFVSLLSSFYLSAISICSITDQVKGWNTSRWFLCLVKSGHDIILSMIATTGSPGMISVPPTMCVSAAQDYDRVRHWTLTVSIHSLASTDAQKSRCHLSRCKRTNCWFYIKSLISFNSIIFVSLLSSFFLGAISICSMTSQNKKQVVVAVRRDFTK